MIDKALYDQGVMLCSPSKDVAPTAVEAVQRLEDHGGYLFDMKWDGIRSLAFVSDGKARLINRRDVDITYRYPEVKAALERAYPNCDIVLDGEIVVLKEDGTADFDKSHLRDAQQNVRSVAQLAEEFPATLMTFDLLHFGSDDLRRIAFAGRHAILRKQAEGAFAGESTLQWSAPRKDGLTYWNEVQAQGLEGLVAKLATSAYRPGRSSSWVKLKIAFQVTAIVIDYTTTDKGSRKGTFKALQLRLIGPDGAVDIGEVGTGFNNRDLQDVKARIDNDELLCVEVEFGAVTKTGKLRFPSYKGIRTDKVATDCTTDQLDGVTIIK